MKWAELCRIFTRAQKHTYGYFKKTTTTTTTKTTTYHSLFILWNIPPIYCEEEQLNKFDSLLYECFWKAAKRERERERERGGGVS